LVLCCRRPERHQSLIDELEGLGSDVTVAAVDASDPEGLTLTVLSAVQAVLPLVPLASIGIGEAFVALLQRLARGEPGPLEVLFQG
jgi:hypothetical protein